MKLAHYHIFRYRLPFVNLLTMMRKQMSHREGFILKLESANGAAGFGEVAPFPGLSKETLNEALEELRQAMSVLRNTAVDLSFPVIPFLLNDISASVLFGVESAVLEMQAQKQQTSVAKILNPEAGEEVSVQALLFGDKNDIFSQVERIIAAGFRCLKLKVRSEIDKEIDLVRNLRETVGDKISLRLDANRAWNFEQAIRFCTAVRGCNIEYIEEPLENAADLSDLFDRTSVPFALDESLTWESAQNPNAGITAFILKPGIHGGLSRIIQYINLAKNQKRLPVLSCPFYTAIGLNSMAQLAAAFIPPDQPIGLLTFDHFENDLIHQPIQLAGDKLKLEALQANLNVDSDLLGRIE